VASYQILYWEDIPLQVRARDERARVSLLLSERFQAAVDQVAMLAGLTDNDAYTERFHWTDPQELPGTADEVARLVLADLESRYQTIDWRKTAAALKYDR